MDITAQVELEISADGRSAKVPVLVQPGCDLVCLLDMNVIPKLGIQFLRANGQPICAEASQDSKVRLVHTTTIPARKARFVDAVVEGNFSGGDDVVFEPDRSTLKELGLSSMGSVLTVQPGGKVLIPFHNHQNSCTNVEKQVIVSAVLTIEADQITSLVDKGVCQSEEGNNELVGPNQGNGDVNVVHSDADRRDHMRKVLRKG